MKSTSSPRADVHVELGDPVPYGEESSRHLLVAGALGARAGTADAVDLALLSAASRLEDLRHYQQLEFTPLDRVRRWSVARVRHLDTGEEEMIARGDLDAILYLCRMDEASRYRADLLADLDEVHGYRAVGVAAGTGPFADGSETWRYLGFIPVTATRLRTSRRQEPSAYRYVRVWDWQLRLLHWSAFFAIIVLCLTGWLIGGGRFAVAGAASDPYFIGYVRLVHFTVGWLLLAAAILRVAGLFLASTKYQRWRALFPITLRDLKNLLQVVRNYLFCIFEHGPHYVGHNPLQQVAYTGIYLMGIVAIVTGFCLYSLYDAGNPLFTPFLWLNGLVGVQLVRLIHLFMMWVFLIFIPIHVYLSIRADTVEREGAISSIFSGGRWCRKGTRFEDEGE
ncbi:MAG TPA: Ni/Fe-hydrogenase, b-type cytochrome subunit [Geobacteraceae bacterium]